MREQQTRTHGRAVNEANDQSRQVQQYSHKNEVAQATQAGGQMPFSAIAKSRVVHKYGMTEQQWAVYDAALSIGLLTLRTAFPTQTRNYSDREHDMLTALWLEMFAEVNPSVLQEAIMRFIAADRKGFFPSPGMVIGIAEEIVTEREKLEADERMKRHVAELCEIQRRIDGGENCSTCRFCVSRDVATNWQGQQTETRLFCQNINSYKYDGDYRFGTAASILCEYYEPSALALTVREGLNDGASDG